MSARGPHKEYLYIYCKALILISGLYEINERMQLVFLKFFLESFT